MDSYFNQIEWTTTNEEILIGLVKDKPILWDNRLFQYRNTREKEKIWKGIDQMLKKPVGSSERRFYSLREKYRRYINKEKDAHRSGSAQNLLQKFYLADRMQFLRDTMRRRNAHTDSLRVETSRLDTSEQNSQQSQASTISVDFSQHEQDAGPSYSHRSQHVVPTSEDFRSQSQPTDIENSHTDNRTSLVTSQSLRPSNTSLSSKNNRKRANVQIPQKTFQVNIRQQGQISDSPQEQIRNHSNNFSSSNHELPKKRICQASHRNLFGRNYEQPPQLNLDEIDSEDSTVSANISDSESQVLQHMPISGTLLDSLNFEGVSQPSQHDASETNHSIQPTIDSQSHSPMRIFLGHSQDRVSRQVHYRSTTQIRRPITTPQITRPTITPINRTHSRNDENVDPNAALPSSNLLTEDSPPLRITASRLKKQMYELAMSNLTNIYNNTNLIRQAIGVEDVHSGFFINMRQRFVRLSEEDRIRFMDRVQQIFDEIASPIENE
ncbi:uncharacterized protein LOC129803028 [Phlebotomus papatasi]|uniref:uncharacterized protein LOC129803028 n=1 Tax=Phlebotomus papatasi TaxID=29031 RepID=UPI0024835190|nr:uncharacterized protein LOC129803028 [Phlebotomus papatasi]